VGTSWSSSRVSLALRSRRHCCGGPGYTSHSGGSMVLAEAVIESFHRILGGSDVLCLRSEPFRVSANHCYSFFSRKRATFCISLRKLRCLNVAWLLACLLAVDDMLHPLSRALNLKLNLSVWLLFFLSKVNRALSCLRWIYRFDSKYLITQNVLLI